MARLTWDISGQRFYQAGVDQGVLYTGSLVVPWSGLISVSENPNGGDASPYYLDGQKVLNVSSGENFDGTIETFAFPVEFSACAGRIVLAAGLYAADQPKETFGFSYRTLIGNDSAGLKFAYKIHVVYNALAQIADFEHTTVSDSVTPKSYSFDFATVPVAVPGYRPAAHYVFDNRLMTSDLLAQAETILYGDDTNDPRIPTVDDLVTLLAS